MGAALAAVSFSSVAEGLLLSLRGASLKGSLVFAVVYVTTRLMRGSHPALRHLLWLGAICSYLLILLLTLVSPPLLPMQPLAPVARGTLYGTVSSLLRSAGNVPGFQAAGTFAVAAGMTPPAESLWTLPLLLLWVAGIGVNLVPVAAGSIRAHRLIAEAGAEAHRRPRQDSALQGLGREVGVRLSVTRPARVVQSAACRVPFAAGVFHPVVVLPLRASAWPAQRLRAVMLHELCHVRRGDCLSQVAARCVCSLFWFVPLVWIAYWFLHTEQEKACDAEALGNGVSPLGYASCLLQVAHRRVRPAAFAGLYSPLWRRRMLEDRIRHIMHPSPATAPRWPALATSAVLFCALVLLGGARWKETLSNEQAYRRFIGTWVNTEYPGTLLRSQITVIRTDYVGEDWLFPDSASPEGQWTIAVKKTWVDEEGNTYCQFFIEYTKGTKFRGEALMRTDNKGELCEINSRKADRSGATSRWMEEIDPALRNYWMYYRKE